MTTRSRQIPLSTQKHSHVKKHKRPLHKKRHPRHHRPHPLSGVLPPEQSGHGWRLVTEGLSAPNIAATLKTLVGGPLNSALHRRAPLGPSLAQRPDVRDARELAAPGNSIDMEMAEMAQAVMSYWGDGADLLPLDETGVAVVAAGVTSEPKLMDDDDVTACGAFVGEVLRKRTGGHWTGFDDRYMLEIGENVADPLGWVRDAYNNPSGDEASGWLLERFYTALGGKARSVLRTHTDPSGAFEVLLRDLCTRHPRTPMRDLLAETRPFSFRLTAEDWPGILVALEPLLAGRMGVRAAAAIALYAPAEGFAALWALFGRKQREAGFAAAVCEAMKAAAERDDLLAMPNWTVQPEQPHLSFLNPLRKQMEREDWRKVLLLLLRQRAAAGDMAGVGWCLYSYKYEFRNSLTLIKLFCEMVVSARETVLRASINCTRDERKLFRSLWAEGLRDPSPAVVCTALDAVGYNNVRSLRKHAEALAKDPREGVSAAASELLRVWKG